MEPERGLVVYEEMPSEPTDLLSSVWCSSAIQVLQTEPKDSSMALVENPVATLDIDRKDLLQGALQKSDSSLVVDNSGFSTAPWKYDDVKSWIWLQKAIHPELDYDQKKKWLPRKMAPWGGVSLKKWVKERKQKRKEEARLHRAEVHAAVSVASVAAALAAIAAESAAPPAPGSARMRETAVASAAALVAEQCAKVAEAAGASRDHIAAAVCAARASPDAGNVFTLTAAAATSLRGAATLRGRRSSAASHSQNERAEHTGAALSQDDLDFDFNHARSRAALAKGDEMFVAMLDGKWKVHAVSAASNKNGEIVLRIKKANLVMAFSHAKESVVKDVRPCAPEKPSPDEGATYPVDVMTSKGKVELRADDYAVYKRWVATLSHMLVMSTAVSTRNEPPRLRRD